MLAAAAGLAAVGTVTKFVTGWVGAKRLGVGTRGRIRAGTTLIARGEFSIAIAGLATTAGIDPEFEALAVSYVFVLAIAGPLLVRISEPITEHVLARASRAN